MASILTSMLVLGVVASAVVAKPAICAEIKATPGKDARVVISIVGEIVPGDADAFIDLVKKANAAGRFVANVRLNSPGGNLLEGVRLADTIKTAKIATNVGQSAMCASACFLVFAAGSEKNASYGAQIGVHGASSPDGEETVQSGAATVSMARVAKELGVPPAIIGRMVVTPPDQMVWLSSQDLQSMGVILLGKPRQTENFPPVANLQQVPSGDPTPVLPPQASAVAPSSKNDVIKWEQIVEKAIQRSASQNNGKPAFVRSCQPEQKVCIIGITYLNNDGKLAFLKTVEDMNGKMIAREACTMVNEFNDVRTCLDWDKGTQHRDMKNEKGDWIEVADH
jgi:hypothetical protein